MRRLCRCFRHASRHDPITPAFARAILFPGIWSAHPSGRDPFTQPAFARRSVRASFTPPTLSPPSVDTRVARRSVRVFPILSSSAIRIALAQRYRHSGSSVRGGVVYGPQQAPSHFARAASIKTHTMPRPFRSTLDIPQRTSAARAAALWRPDPAVTTSSRRNRPADSVTAAGRCEKAPRAAAPQTRLLPLRCALSADQCRRRPCSRPSADGSGRSTQTSSRLDDLSTNRSPQPIP